MHRTQVAFVTFMVAMTAACTEQSAATVSTEASTADAALTSGYQFPMAKQGVTDYAYGPSGASTVQNRYAALAKLGLGLKIYNFFWSSIESTVAGSTTPLQCPSGTMMVPSSAADMQSQGYHAYHCYNTGTVNMFDTMMQLDQQNGFQSAVVMWSAPAFYRVPGCEGFDNGGYTEYGGCVPNDGAMDHYEDYVNFLASRYNGGSNGKISHFIVWNEVASGAWFDYSPTIETNRPVTDPAIKSRWINKYVDMLTRSRTAVNRHTPASLVEVSLDFLFTSGGMNGPKAHIGGKTVLDGIWSRVGTNYSWSIAIHPYGDPADADQGPNVINFYGLRYLTQYQQQHLTSLGVSQPLSAPQSWLFASEQGWFDTTLDSRAVNMCKAHNIVLSMPNVVGTTHNHFQGQSDADNGIGLVPYEAGFLLQNGAQYPTYQAYLSTGPQVWGKRNDHYCCQNAHLGCIGAPAQVPAPVGPASSTTPSVPTTPTAPSNPTSSTPAPNGVLGIIDGVQTANGKAYLGGWACDVGHLNSIYVDLYVNGPAGQGKGVARFTANLASEPAVASLCQTTGSAYRFSIDLTPFRANYANATLYLHGISVSGGSNNLLVRSGNFTMPAP